MGLRTLLVVGVSALVLGTALGFVGGRLTDDKPVDSPEPVGLIAEGELASVPGGPVAVRAERVVLPAGFNSRHFHGGPTFNFVDAGTVVIESGGQQQRYSEGGFFFEPARRVHAITVLDNGRLRVIRLLPPGVEATTKVP